MGLLQLCRTEGLDPGCSRAEPPHLQSGQYDWGKGRGDCKADLLGEASFTLGLAQGVDQVGQGTPIDAAPRPHRGETNGRGQVAFSGAWRAEKVQHLGALDELQLGQGPGFGDR